MFISLTWILGAKTLTALSPHPASDYCLRVIRCNFIIIQRYHVHQANGQLEQPGSDDFCRAYRQENRCGISGCAYIFPGKYHQNIVVFALSLFKQKCENSLTLLGWRFGFKNLQMRV